MDGALFVSKKTGEFSKGKLMVKNCMDAIFDTGPFQSGVGAIWKGRQEFIYFKSNIFASLPFVLLLRTSPSKKMRTEYSA